MALYKKNQSRTKIANSPIFEPHSFKNRFAGQSCFLCGTGPSLGASNLGLIEKSGAVVVALNNAFTKIKPHIWMGVDEVGSFDPSLFSSDFMKIYQWQRRDELFKRKKVCDLNNFYFFIRADEDVHTFGGELTTFIYEGNTFASAIHILYWMGFKTVYLVGCDFGGSNALSKVGPLYQEKKYNAKTQKTHLTGALDFLKFSSGNNSVDYISCTPGSPINEFLEYRTIKEAAGDVS